MPNWTSNTIKMTHEDPKMIERAATAFRDGTLLEEFIPLPEYLKDENGELKRATNPGVALEGKKQTYESWYDFCVNEWGTKWDISPYSCEVVDQNTLEGSFESAWSPPIEAYRKLEELGFHIEATYYEPGVGFCGGYSEGYDDAYEIPGTAAEADIQIPEYINEAHGISEYMREYEEEIAEDEESA